MSDLGWEWDPSLYQGSAAYYVKGRVGYPQAFADRLAAELELDGRGRLLDVVASLAQSFHWMDRTRVAGLLHGGLASGGALVLVRATTTHGVESAEALPFPRPPRHEIEGLVRRFLGTERRAGRSRLPESPETEAETHRRDAEIFRTAGFTSPTRLDIPGRVVVRHTDDIVASVFSLSGSAPHLFGDRQQDFETELRELLREASPDGQFSEQMRESAIDVWRV